jgi:DNA-binding FadR family transcriptional regulator
MTSDTRKLYQRVAETLAEAIAAGRYAVGSRLPAERDLAIEFEVSRPTIREAMIALEMRGMVEARNKSGVYVMDNAAGHGRLGDLDVGAFELIEARTMIEGEAAALAAVAIDDATIARLRELVDAMTLEADQRGKVDVDREFHLLIAHASGNGLVRSMIESLWDLRERSPMCVHMFAQARRNGVAPREDEHRLIVEALAARDSKAARQTMRNHLVQVTEDLLEATKLESIQRVEADYDAHRNRVTTRAWA